jgi:hypothetical protein
MDQTRLALFIPIVGIIMGVGAGMVSMYLAYRKRREIYTLYHQERLAAIEKGLDLPPLPDEFFGEETKGGRPPRHLFKGLVWLFMGTGLLVAMYADHEGTKALYSLIPIGLGLAHLVYYFVEGRPPGSGLGPGGKE